MTNEPIPKHSLSARICYPFFWAGLSLLFLLLGPVRVVGRYRVPRKGKLLIVSNHQADLDPVIIQLSCPRLVHYMAKSELFQIPVLSSFMRWYMAFPVKRGEPDRQAIKFGVEVLKAEEALVVFPEGQLSEDGLLQPILPGAALIARLAGATAICVGLKGTNKMLPYGKIIPRPAFSWVTVTWGEPRTFTKDVENEEVIAWIEGQLRELTGQEPD